MSESDNQRAMKAQDDADIDAFAAQMKAKMDKYRPAGGNQWRRVYPPKLIRLLTNARNDRDWISVANYAMMLWVLHEKFKREAQQAERDGKLN